MKKLHSLHHISSLFFSSSSNKSFIFCSRARLIMLNNPGAPAKIFVASLMKIVWLLPHSTTGAAFLMFALLSIGTIWKLLKLSNLLSNFWQVPRISWLCFATLYRNLNWRLFLQSGEHEYFEWKHYYMYWQTEEAMIIHM